MSKKPISLFLVLSVLLLAALPARAEFHFEDDMVLTTPQIGTFQNNKGAYVPHEQASGLTQAPPSAHFDYAAPSAGQTPQAYMPPANQPTTIGLAPATPIDQGAMNTQRVVLSSPTSEKPSIERHYDRFMDWSSKLAGGKSYQDASKNGLPRGTMVTRIDKVEAGLSE